VGSYDAVFSAFAAAPEHESRFEFLVARSWRSRREPRGNRIASMRRTAEYLNAPHLGAAGTRPRRCRRSRSADTWMRALRVESRLRRDPMSGGVARAVCPVYQPGGLRIERH
jgi:hypothetical protein